MANQLFDQGRRGFLDGSIDWDTAVIKAALVRGYTSANITTTHSVMSDVTAIGTIVATSPALTNKTTNSPVGGVADADDVTWATVAAGAAIPTIIIFQSSAVTGGADVASTLQRLIAFIDTATGLPVTPNGGDITAVWSSGADRIFRL